MRLFDDAFPRELRLEPPRLGVVELRLLMRMLADIDLGRGRSGRLAPYALGFLRTHRAKGRRRDAAENIKQRATFACAPSLRLRFRRRLRR